MTEGNYKHMLAAILSADVVGYSRLRADDEVATIRTLSACLDKIGAHVKANGGRVADFTGGNTLAEFSSALQAVECAVPIQTTLKELNTQFDKNRQMQLSLY